MDKPIIFWEGEVPEQHDIVFNHVSFGYGEKEILHDVSVEFRPGTINAIVKPSGSRKSTMLRLIARFYDSQNGMLHFGGVDETTIEPEKLMRKISVVFQNTI